MRLEKTMHYHDSVYPPDGLPDDFVKRAIKKVKSIHRFIEFEYLSYIHIIQLKLRVYFEPVIPRTALSLQTEITNAANALRNELNKSNELYQLLKDVYGLEPKKSWWARITGG